MELPVITLPKIELPFDIPVLLHPSIDHFAIALPIIILFIEFYNLFARRKSVGGFSFILILLTVIAFVAAYFTGVVDGKEAYDLLSPEGQEALKAHKLLGTYLLLASVALLFFKLLSMTGKGFFKFIFFMVLIGFIVVTFKQGKEGGELVYTYGANVERVKVLDDKLFDANDALEELKSTTEYIKAKKPEVAKTPDKVKMPAKIDKPIKVDVPVTSVNIPTPATPEVEVVVPTQEVPTPKTPPVDQTPTLQIPEAATKVDSLLESAQKSMENINGIDNKAQSLEEETSQKVIDVIQQEIQRPKIKTH